jgi:transposase
MSPSGAAAKRPGAMKGHLLMSPKERRRIAVVEEVKAGRLKVVEAAQALGLSYRQSRRIWRRYQKDGDAGLVHRLRGKPSGRAKKAELKTQVLARVKARYADFGPTLAAEHLEGEGLKVDHETLRRWMMESGQWSVRRQGRKHRKWRERRANFGSMVQLDGSHHDWFEGRRGKCVLMVMVDDATNLTEARFFEEETTGASYGLMEVWIRRHGVPQSLYVDRDSIYRCERMATVEEEVSGKGPQTQFGRAMRQLGVELILANSPQAKGRVERRNGLLQDRLVKALRLEGIADLEEANRYLERKFLPELNRKFQVEAASPADVHGKYGGDLKQVLSWEEERTVQKDWTVAWKGKWYQLERESAGSVRSGVKIVVRRLQDGSLQMERAGNRLKWRELPARPERTAAAPRKVGRVRLAKPAATHAWRRFGAAVGKRWKAGVTKEGQPRRRAAPQGQAGTQSASATLRPPSSQPAPAGKRKGTFSPESGRGHS